MRDDTLSFAKTASGGQGVDLSALIRRRSQVEDHPPALPPAARRSSAAATGSSRRTSPFNWPRASQAVMGEKRPPVAERPPAVRP